MQQNHQPPNGNMDGLLNTVGKKLGIAPEELRQQLESGKFDAAMRNMSPQEAAKFQQAVNNPKLIEKLMSSSQAQALYRKLTGGN